MRGAVTIVAGTLLLAGCSFGDEVPVANKAIDGFHHTLDAGQFDAIYAASGAQMKSTTTQERFVQFLSAVHRKLGAFRSGKSVGWNDNTTPSGHFMTVNYAATYAQGPAQESFVYRIDGKQVSLVGYHINSDVLILN